MLITFQNLTNVNLTHVIEHQVGYVTICLSTTRVPTQMINFTTEGDG